MEHDLDVNSLIDALRNLDGAQRPLRMALGMPGEPVAPDLFPQRIEAKEAFCEGLECRIQCLAQESGLPLKEWIAQPIELHIVTDRGGLRSLCGFVTQARAGESDGGLATYQLLLQDGLAVLEKRVNTRVFRGKNEIDIVELLFDEWRHANTLMSSCFRLELDAGLDARTLPKREFTMQHNESDAHFIRRLLRRRGLAWFFRPGGEGSRSHSMVVCGASALLQESAAGAVRYHRADATEERDAITAWSAVHSLQAGATARFSWDYTAPQARDFMLTRTETSADKGRRAGSLNACLEDYIIAAPHLAEDNDDLCQLGALRMASHDLAAHCFHGEGSVRDLRVGEWFSLEGHPDEAHASAEERRYVLTAQQFQISNNLPKDLDARAHRLLSHGQQGEDWGNKLYVARFTCVRKGVALVPAFDAHRDLPRVHIQSAMVVGPPGEEVYTDALGRVKLRFPGTREADHAHASGAGAADTDVDSAWVRVAAAWAGAGPSAHTQCGVLGLPRVGTEVLVEFLGGDPDKPIVTGQLYNGDGVPPAISEGGGLPGNRYLAGIKSKEIGGARANRLSLDDTKGEIGARLASDHGATALNLGWLGTPRQNGRAKKRGAGAELRSDMATAVRGGAGVLISAQESQGEQLERGELLGLLQQLEKLLEQLAKAAGGDKPSATALHEVHETLKQMQDGAPLLALSGPAGIAMGSGASLSMNARADVGLCSGADTRCAAGGSTSLRAVDAISLFANNKDIKVTAAQGQLQLHAEQNNVEILARKVLELISATDYIDIKARKGVRIYGGGSEILIDESGIKAYAKGKFDAYATEHEFHAKQARTRQFPDEVVPYEVCKRCLDKAGTVHDSIPEKGFK